MPQIFPMETYINLKVLRQDNFIAKINVLNVIGNQVFSNSYAIAKRNNLLNMDI